MIILCHLIAGVLILLLLSMVASAFLSVLYAVLLGLLVAFCDYEAHTLLHLPTFTTIVLSVLILVLVLK